MQQHSRRPTVVVVMGVSGSGKTTIASRLSKALGWPFEEGDDLHSADNRAKMAAGTPLTDADRGPWLAAVRSWIDAQLDRGADGVITCSALRARYRSVLRRPGVQFVYLDGSRELLAERMSHRTGHFMPASLLDSQLATLEDPTGEPDVLTVSLGGTPEQEASRVLRALRRQGVVSDLDGERAAGEPPSTAGESSAGHRPTG